ncbi:MAG TPA: cysteine--tRNA ligase, partial [Candidatus Kryptobacter bacterium]|nr:cysteine--tRNA ligase [Candidatus Kryptobacter bacterium]
NGTKMSKSLGNFVTLKDAFKKFDPITVRFFILQSHYRSPLDYSDEAVEGAGKGLERLKNVMRQLEEMGADPAAKIDFDNLPEEPINLRRYYNEWFAAMADDFNTPSAIAVLFEMFKDINSLIASGAAMTSDFATLLSAYTRTLAGDVLGIIPSENRDSSDKNVETELVNLLIKMRADARKNRDFKLADSIRTELQDIGVMLEDKKDGTTTFKVSK